MASERNVLKAAVYEEKIDLFEEYNQLTIYLYCGYLKEIIFF